MNPIYSDADMAEREEIRKIVEENRKNDKTGFRGFITEEEWKTRRKLNLSCDGYRLIDDLKKIARGDK